MSTSTTSLPPETSTVTRSSAVAGSSVVVRNEPTKFVLLISILAALCIPVAFFLLTVVYMLATHWNLLDWME